MVGQQLRAKEIDSENAIAAVDVRLDYAGNAVVRPCRKSTFSAVKKQFQAVPKMESWQFECRIDTF